MSDPSDYYAPNQQVVRADGSGPAEEGNGGADTPVPHADSRVSHAQQEVEVEHHARRRRQSEGE